MDVAACRQVIGKDFHASAIVGGDNLNSDGADFGIETGWAQTEHQPKGTAHSGHLLEPTAVAFNSQHVRDIIQLLCSLHPHPIDKSASPLVACCAVQHLPQGTALCQIQVKYICGNTQR